MILLGVEVRSRVAVRGVVTAPDVPALHAEAQVDPAFPPMRKQSSQPVLDGCTSMSTVSRCVHVLAITKA